jgi:TonB family protein
VHRIRIFVVALLFGACWNTLSVAQVAPSDSAYDKVAVVALAPPVYPQMARVANIWGDVSVAVKLRSDGTVKSVAAISGPPMLKQAALDSARQTRFESRGCSTATEPYQMLYTFRMVDSGDCCSALSVPAAIEQRSQSSNSDERWHTRVIVTAQRSCICDPVVKTTREKVRSLKCLYLWKCSTR